MRAALVPAPNHQQVAGMAEPYPSSQPSPTSPSDRLPTVQLTVSSGPARPTVYEVVDDSFLIGSVPGCDLRLAGTSLPPVICLVARRSEGVMLRKLAPAQAIQVNGRPMNTGALADGDAITIGRIEIRLSITAVEAAPPPLPIVEAVEFQQLQLQEDVAKLEAEHSTWQRRRDEQQDQIARLESEQSTWQRRREELEEQVTRLEAEKSNQQGRRDNLRDEIARLESEQTTWQRRREEIEEQVGKLETDKSTWQRRREDLFQEMQSFQLQQTELTSAREDFARQLQELTDGRREVEQQRQAFTEQMEQLRRRQEDVELVRRELVELRRQLYDQYRERRDRLSGLKESVSQAARKVQERKRTVDAEAILAAGRQQDEENRRAELDAYFAQLEQEKAALAEKERKLEEQTVHCLVRERTVEAECHKTTRELEEKRKALAKNEEQYQADLLQLGKLQVGLEQREQKLQLNLQDLEERTRKLEAEHREQEEQAQQLEQWHKKLCTEADQLSTQKQSQEQTQAELTTRQAEWQQQQTALTELRTQLDQQQEILRGEEQHIAVQRGRLAELDDKQQRTVQELERQQGAIDEARQLVETERKNNDERAAQLADAALKLRETQEKLAIEGQRLQEQALAQDRSGLEQSEQSKVLQARSMQLLEMQERLNGERQSLREREAALMQAEQARLTLQEQLRRRSEELAERQKVLAEQTRQRDEERTALETRRVEIERQARETEQQQIAVQQQLEERARAMELEREELSRREGTIAGQQERLKESGREIAAIRKALAEERAEWQQEKQTADAVATQARTELEAIRTEIGSLQKQLPELELSAKGAVDRLVDARAQLSEHLEEVHAFARQRQEDLETLRKQLREEAERVREQSLVLSKSRDEHRLSVASFRQQIIAWQGQVTELRRILAQDETRLERRQAEINEAARAVSDTTVRLAEQAEQLQEQERAVAVRRDEVEGHLTDMRVWYRRKLRELALGSGADLPPVSAPAESGATRDILALTGDVDPGDRRLGDTLRSLELVEADTLSALLIEARRQRRSLRQVLLASGHVTLYQLALIEAGNIDALMLGPVRVIDRLRLSAHETVYRVFDPRRSQDSASYAVLRHLAESAMQDAVRPDEFRQRFAAAAAVQHPNLAATLEVMEIAARPAALQEWVTGLPSADWSELAAVPGIAYRLLCQAALGLHTAHQASIIHGHLHAGQLVLTGEGILKLCGLGEPPWLIASPDDVLTVEEPKAPDDLLALGKLASGWLAPNLRAKGKQKPAIKPLLDIVERLSVGGEKGYASAATVLEDLGKIAASVPANAEAWDRLLRLAREQSEEELLLKQSA